MLSTPSVHAQTSSIAPSQTPPPTSTPPTLAPLAPSYEEASEQPKLQERLWNKAYDDLRSEQPKLVDAYEKLLSSKLRSMDSSSTDEANEINQTDWGKRQFQMNTLVKAGLEKNQKAATVEKRVQGVLQIVDTVRRLIDGAVQSVPQAAIAWTGVCFALEVLANPTGEAITNRDGIAYVVSRVEWYWNLSPILEQNKSDISARLGGNLEGRIVGLYKELLSYEMKSACLYYKNKFAVMLRNVVKLDDWENTLETIKDMENNIKSDVDTFNSTQATRTLIELVEKAEIIRSNICKVVIDQTAAQEKMREKEKDSQCLADLRVTDPSADKTRIESTKGGLHWASSSWVLEHEYFRQWHDDDESRILWIKGGPGKGKTMLLITIINELEQLMEQKSSASAVLSYFFCQATSSALNNAQAVLRGLIYRLCVQRPSLISHLREKYDTSGPNLFRDQNSFYALSKVMESLLQDESLPEIYIVVDALDECETEFPELLKFVVDHSTLPRVKWIISSRNRPNIEKSLRLCDSKLILDLESTAQVSEAVNTYVNFKLSKIPSIQEDDDLKAEANKSIHAGAGNTFLWVALVVQQLTNVDEWNILTVIESMPKGLDGIYGRMLEQIGQYGREDSHFCKQVLSTVLLAYRPLRLAEMAVLSGLPQKISTKPIYIEKIVNMCCSFLNVRDGYIYLVHQSARDYFLSRKENGTISSQLTNTHQKIFTRSLESMSSLQRNIYKLPYPGLLISEIETPNPNPLVAMRYSCIHWIDHFCDFYGGIQNPPESDEIKRVSLFFQEKFIYWLEASSLVQEMDSVISAITRLEGLLKEQSSDIKLLDLIRDSRRFTLHNVWIIRNAPLQIYTSALIFSPVQSLTRQRFRDQVLEWIKLEPNVEYTWSACLQTLEWHDKQYVRFMELRGSDSRLLLVSGGDGATIKIWNTLTGSLRRTLRNPYLAVNLAVLSHDSKILALSTRDKGIITIWDVESGSLRQSLKSWWRKETYQSMAFSHDSKLLAAGSWEGGIDIWNMETEFIDQTFGDGIGYSADRIVSITFSHDSKLLASVHIQGDIDIWDMENRCHQQRLKRYGEHISVHSAIFSHDSKYLVWVDTRTIQILNMETRQLQRTIRHLELVSRITLSHDSKLVASYSDSYVRIWGVENGNIQRKFQCHTPVNQVIFLQDSKLLALGLVDGSIKILDVAMMPPATQETHTQEAPSTVHELYIQNVVLSRDAKLLASISTDSINIWDAATGSFERTLGDSRGGEKYLAIFSHDSKLFAALGGEVINIWDVATGSLQKRLYAQEGFYRARLIALSHDRRLLAVAIDLTIKIWDVDTCSLKQSITVEGGTDTMSFDDTDRFLDTEAGRIDVDDGILDLTRTMSSSRTSEPDKNQCGYDLNNEKSWITWNGRNVIWIPPDYRPFDMEGSYVIFPLISELTQPPIVQVILGAKLRIVCIGLSSLGPTPL
ncbi:WD40 repeat-like protein [Annulohypoxylon moriforme]|nr:WD40 repeat-like protein [Annulohypoxylon moriforme]